MPRHAIVIPCFNEEQRLPAQALTAYADEHPEVHFVLVDDGSTDGTLAVLRALGEERPAAFTVVALETNAGKAEAVRQGVHAAQALRPTTFGYWDADLSTPLEEIGAFAALLEARPTLHLVMGSRVKLLGRDVRRRAARHYAGRVFATFASLALDLPVYDTQCGAKLFRTSAATRWVFRRPFRSRWLFDVEILARMGLLGRRARRLRTDRCVYERPLSSWRDVAGSKLKLRHVLRAVVDLAGIAWRFRCTRRRL